MNKKFLAYILPFLLFIPSVFAKVEEDFVVNSFIGLKDGVVGLAHHESDLFVQGLVGILPLIGLVIIIWGLMFFITRVTIFKSPDHDRYAKMFAWGIALIGVAQRSVFNAILGLSKTFLILTFIIAIVFMFILFINHNRTTHYEMNKTLFDKKEKYLESKSTLYKEKRVLRDIEHDMSLDKKNYDKIKRDAYSLDSDLRDLNRLAGNELSQVEKMLELTRKLISAAETNDKNKVHKYVETLSRDLSGLLSTLSHEKKDIGRFERLKEDIQRHEEYLFKDEKGELKDEEHIKKILKHHLKTVHSHNEASAEKAYKNMLDKDYEIKRNLTVIRHSVLELRSLQNKMTTHLEDLRKFDSDSKHRVVSEVRDALLSYDFKETLNRLNHLHHLINSEEHQLKELSAIEFDINKHLGKLRRAEDSLTHAVHEFERMEARS